MNLSALPLCFGAALIAPCLMAEEAKWTHESSDIPADSQAVFGKLANGMKYIIRPNAEPPGRMSIRLRVAAGSLDESEEQRGLAHFLEHMVFNGSTNFKPGEMIPTMQRLGLGFGGDANAFTSFDQTVYMLDLPNLQPETLKSGFLIMRDFADGALFVEKELNKERGVIMNEKALRESIETKQMEQSLSFLLEGTIVAERLPIGTEEVITKAPRERFVKFYQDHYNPENITLIVVGDVKPEEAKKWIEDNFSSMKSRGKAAPANIGKLKPQQVRAKLISSPEATRTSVQMLNIKPAANLADNKKQRIAELPLQLAHAIVSKRLSELTKQGDCPFVAASMDRDELFNVATFDGISLMCQPDKWQQSLAMVEQQLRMALEFGFSPAELEEVKKNMLNAASTAVQSYQTVRSNDLASAMINTLADGKVLSEPKVDLAILEEGLAALDVVTVQKALQQNWNADQAQIIVSGNASVEGGEQQILAAYKQSRAQKVEAPKHEDAGEFAYDKLPQAGKILASKTIEDLGVEQLELDNGIKVNLKPSSFEKDKIILQARFGQGKAGMPKDQPGLDMLAAPVVNMGGLQAHNNKQIQQLFAGRNVGWSFNIAEDAFEFNGQTTRKDLELQLKLLVAGLAHPGMRDEGELVLKRMLPMMYAKLESDPAGVLRSKALPWLYRQHEQFSHPTLEQMQQRSTAEVVAWLKQPFAEAEMELSIVGDFDPQELKQLLCSTIGTRAKAKTAQKPVTAPVSLVKEAQTKQFFYPSSLDKSLASVAWSGVNGNDKKLVRRAKILADILENRLQDKIREEMGDTYTPQVMFKVSEVHAGAGMFLAVSPGVTESTERVCKAIVQVADDMAKGNLSQDEFERVRRPLLMQQQKQDRSNEFWLSAVLQDSSVKAQRFADYRERISDLNSIELAELNKLAASLFGKQQAVVMQVLPQKPQGEPKDDKQPEANQQGGGGKAGLRKGLDSASLGAACLLAPLGALEASAAAQGADMCSWNVVAPAAGSTTQAAVAADTRSASEYVVLASKQVVGDSEWNKVVQALVKKHKAKVLVFENDPQQAEAELKKLFPRYLAVVAKPEQIGRKTVTSVNRLSRRLDDDVYGDCMWGLISGYSAKDALRMAEASKPLIIKRALGTTNFDHMRFEETMAITDWGPNNTNAKSGAGVQPTKTDHPDSPQGMVGFFADFVTKKKPQFVVTSAHATQYNLEMPFGKGLIASYDNKFYSLTQQQIGGFAGLLQGALFKGTEAQLKDYLDKVKAPQVKCDSEPKVWLAAGNCLIGDANYSKNSMVITAISSFGCNQFCGYVVPSWYGKGGWGVLGSMFSNSETTTLSEAYFLNNQSIVEETMRRFPKLMQVNFDFHEINAALQNREFCEAIAQTGYAQQYPDQHKDIIGLVHDRDTVAFWGDPLYQARVDQAHGKSPWIFSNSAQGISVKSNYAHKGSCYVWLPKRVDPAKLKISRGSEVLDVAKIGVATDDFVLIRELELAPGQQLEISW